MSNEYFIDVESKLMSKQFHSQRWFYSIIGFLLILGIILLTLGQIQDMNKDNNEFAFCLLLIIHSIYVLICLLATAVFCRMTNAVLTTLTILLLSAYTGVHFYIRFLLFHNYSKDEFYLLTIRLGFVVILVILLLPWTNVMVHKYRMTILHDQDRIYPRSTTFSWFLYLDFILIISLLVLNIRNQLDFHFYHLVFIAIGLSLALIWLCMGMLMAKNITHHLVVSTSFYILSCIQIIHLAHLTYTTILEYNMLSKVNELTLFPLLIIILISSATNVLIHLLTILISFVFMDKI